MLLLVALVLLALAFHRYVANECEVFFYVLYFSNAFSNLKLFGSSALKADNVICLLVIGHILFDKINYL